MRRNVKILFVLSMLLLTMGLVACESARTEPNNPADSAATMVAQGTPESAVTLESASTDGATTDGAVTDGAATDGAATDGATTDGATDGGEATVVAVDGSDGGEAATDGSENADGGEGSEAAQSYAVQAGDTLQSIADQFGTTIDDLRAKNNLESDFLTVGQELVVAGDATMTDGDTTATGDEVAAQGDGTDSGSTDGGTDSGSDASGDDSSDGSNVTPPSESVIHTVQSGEWIYAIARQYGVTPQAIIAANPGIDTNNLYVGQQLTIPGTNSGNSGSNNGANTSGGTVNYVVQPGDTLYGIAGVFGISVDAIRQANGLPNNVIYAGQSLVIPQ